MRLLFPQLRQSFTYTQLDHTPIVGIKQSGKTTTALKILDAHDRYIKFFFNTKWEKKWNKYMKWIAYPNHIKDLLKDVYSNPKFYTSGLICVYPDPDKGKRSITPITKYIRKRHQYNNWLKTCMLIDEGHNYQSVRSLDAEIQKVFVYGGMGFKVLMTAQTPQQIHREIRDNSDSYILHKTKPAALDYLMEKQIIQPHERDKFIFPSKYTAYIKPSEMEGWRRLQ